MWYVIQTVTGKELELVGVIDRVLKGKGGENGSSYKECFVIQRECVWRLGGDFRMHIEPLFPSYVFVETDTPEEFFYDLKQIPKLTKLLSGDGTFWTVQKEEELLLRGLFDDAPDYVVRRSPVQVDEEGEIIAAEGILKEYLGMIVKKRLRKRIVVIEIPFLGRMRRIEVGIRVKGRE